jgi:hypothetical protein
MLLISPAPKSNHGSKVVSLPQEHNPKDYPLLYLQLLSFTASKTTTIMGFNKPITLPTKETT